MLSFTLSAQAVPQLDKSSIAPMVTDFGVGQSPNAGQIDDTCATGGFPLGTLTRFMTIAADTTGLANDFGCDPACPAPCFGGCGYYGVSGLDGIATFQVPVSGSWRFSACSASNPAFDSSLAIRAGAPCPGTACVAQDDDSCAACAAPYKSVVTAILSTGVDYYLIADAFSGGNVMNIQVLGPCTTAADCNDGIFCNGAELCTGNRCAAGTPPCVGTTPLCDEATDTCSGCASNPAACLDDGLWCNGPGACLPTGSCGQGPAPCTGIQTCDEAVDTCFDPDPCIAWRAEGTLTGSFSPQAFNGCLDQGQGDDIQLSAQAGRELVSYKTLTQARNLFGNGSCTFGAAPPIPCADEPVGSAYSTRTSLWSTASGGVCTPDTEIAGTVCNLSPGVVAPGGTGGDANVCSPNGGLPTGVIIADADDDPTTGQCGVDAYLVVFTTNGGVGPSINGAVDIGGPAMEDEFLQTVFVTPNNSPAGLWDGTWGFGAFSPPTLSNFRITEVCTVPVGPCCVPASGMCQDDVNEDVCTTGGGTWYGPDELANPQGCDTNDGDGDGVRDECDGCPADPDKLLPGQCGCGVADTDTDSDGTADCNDGCDTDPNKIEPGICGCGTPDTDTDGDGTPDCNDQCPLDPGKVTPGICGCGIADAGDSDADGVLDCVDQCPGVDDAVFFPGCQGAIPTVSEWGMVVLALLLLAGAKVYFGRRTAQA